MLTLGLMEGIIAAAVGALALIAMATGSTPLHRLFAPATALVAGIIAYRIWSLDQADGFVGTLGLLFAAAIVFGVPLAIMRAAWASQRRPAPAVRAVVQSVAPSRAEEPIAAPVSEDEAARTAAAIAAAEIAAEARAAAAAEEAAPERPAVPAEQPAASADDTAAR